MPETSATPQGELTLRTPAMPRDANAAGDIFGGWVKEMSFEKPVKVGDTLCVYTRIDRVGRTSMVLKVEAWAQRYLSHDMEMVTRGEFVMVALDATGRPTPVPPES